MDKNLAKKPLSFIYLFVMTLAFVAGVGAFILVYRLIGGGDLANVLGFIAFLAVCGILSLLGEAWFGPKWNPETQEWEKR